jgi:hypothetical protein
MNIQQINGTGQDISAFGITTAVLLLITLLLWFLLSTLTAFRKRLTEAQERYSFASLLWVEKLLLVNFNTDRVGRTIYNCKENLAKLDGSKKSLINLVKKYWHKTIILNVLYLVWRILEIWEYISPKKPRLFGLGQEDL